MYLISTPDSRMPRTAARGMRGAVPALVLNYGGQATMTEIMCADFVIDPCALDTALRSFS